jgi:MFS family permease
MLGLVLALPTGIILQRLGPKTTLLIALGLTALGAGAGALAGNFLILLGSRVVEALGIGLMGVAAPATIAMWFPPERQGTPMGIWATWVPVGTVVIFNLAPLLESSLSWQSVWWIGAAFALVMMVFCGWLVRHPLVQQQTEREKQPAPDLRLALRNRNIWLLALEFACMNLSMVALGTYYPTFLNEVRGYPLSQAAFIASLGTLTVLFSAPAAGWLSDRIRSRRLVFSLPFLGIAVLFLFPFQVTGWLIIAVALVQGLIIGGIPTATFAAVSEVMQKPEWAGLGLAVILIGQNIGQLVGPILFGEIVKGPGWVMAGYMMIPFCLLGFISGWMVKVR